MSKTKTEPEIEVAEPSWSRPLGIQQGPVLVTLRDWIRNEKGDTFLTIWGRIHFPELGTAFPPLPDNTPAFLTIGEGNHEVLIPWSNVNGISTCPIPPAVQCWIVEEDGDADMNLEAMSEGDE